MMLWITSFVAAPGRRAFLQAFFVFALLLGLSACGSKQSMDGARSDDEMLGTMHDDEASVTSLEGEEDVSFNESAAAPRRRAVPAVRNATRSGSGRVNEVTVQQGDSLRSIAERKDVYGTGMLYPLIYKANKDRIPDPLRLVAGLKLVIPRDVSGAEVEIAQEEAMTGQFLDSSPLGAEQTASVPSKAANASEGGGLGWLWFLILLLAGAGAGYVLWMRRKAAALAASVQTPQAAKPVPGPPPLPTSHS